MLIVEKFIGLSSTKYSWWWETSSSPAAFWHPYFSCSLVLPISVKLQCTARLELMRIIGKMGKPYVTFQVDNHISDNVLAFRGWTASTDLSNEVRTCMQKVFTALGGKSAFLVFSCLDLESIKIPLTLQLWLGSIVRFLQPVTSKTKTLIIVTDLEALFQEKINKIGNLYTW